MKAFLSRLFRVPLVCLLGATLSLSPLSAQQPPGESFKCLSPGEVKDQKLLQALQETYDTLKYFRADFLQYSYLSSVDTSEQSAGTIWFATPGKLRWDYDRPHSHKYVLNGNDFSFLQPEIQQAVRYTVDQVFLSELPVAFLLGLGSIEEQFELEKSCQSNEGVVATLSPKKEGHEQQREELNKLSLLLSPGLTEIQGARIVDMNGNITSILFGEIDQSVEPEENRFSLSVPDGYDLIDNRSQGEIHRS